MAEPGPKREDRRIRRTKKLLHHGLFRLMQEKPLKEITVRELAEECDINRGTFYLYYKDIFDMLEQIEDEMFSALDSILNEQEKNIEAGDTYSVLYQLFSLAEENRDMCQAALSANGDMRFFERLDKMLRRRLQRYWQMLRSNVTQEEFEMGYAFSVFGCIGLLRAWVNSPTPEPAEKMASIGNVLLHDGILVAAKVKV